MASGDHGIECRVEADDGRCHGSVSGTFNNMIHVNEFYFSSSRNDPLCERHFSSTTTAFVASTPEGAFFPGASAFESTTSHDAEC